MTPRTPAPAPTKGGLPRNTRQRQESPAFRYRPPPDPIDIRDWRRFERSERLRNIAKSLQAEYAKPLKQRNSLLREMLMSDLTRSEKSFVQFLVGRGKKCELDPAEYIKAFNLTSPVVVAPEITRKTRAFSLTWSSDILRSFYTAWWDEEIRPRDAAGYEAAKAAMVTAAGARSNPDIKSAVDDVDEKETLSALFVELARAGGRQIKYREYSAVTRHLDRLASVVNELAPAYAAQITQELAALVPTTPVGRFLSIDGTLTPAWTRQKSGRVNGVFDPELDAWLRRRHPEATYRYYSPGRDGREEADEETAKTVRPGGKGVRGHNFVLCNDVLTQTTLSLHGFPATFYEPNAIWWLMPTVFDNWPDIPARYLVADKLWHKRPTHEDLLRRWDMFLVAIPASAALKHITPVPDKHRPKAATIRGDGIVVCREHGLPCEFDQVEVPSRKERSLAGIELGEPMAAGLYRYRVICKHGCGRLNLSMGVDWRATAALPNHGSGKPDKYALRIALQGHRNISEAGFASLQVAYNLLGKDGNRSRLQKNVNQALLWLALLTKAGHLLTAERIQRGIISGEIGDHIAATAKTYRSVLTATG